jgi:5'-phosphate synthase pdxT subunit
MLTLLGSGPLVDALRSRIAGGCPVLATCAGVILLAVAVQPEQPSLGLLDVDVERNAYGRQLDSTIADVELAPGLGQPSSSEGVFIRAPRIRRVGRQVEVLGWWRGDPVLVRQGAILGATYHPELSADRRVHELFLRMEEADEQAVAAAR